MKNSVKNLTLDTLRNLLHISANRLRVYNMVAEFILITMLCTTIDAPCETYQSMLMTSEECELESQKTLLIAQKLEIKETVLTYCTNIILEGN